MDQKKTDLLKEAIAQKKPSIKGIMCQKCGKPMPPIVMYGVGKILGKFEPARHFLGKCRNCGAWHRYDKKSQSWIADEFAAQLATTKFAGSDV